MFKKLDFSPGEVEHDSFDINYELPLVDQIDWLTEHLFQVNYDDEYILDIGWYSSLSSPGKFRIAVVKDFNWSNPIFSKECSRLGELDCYVQEGVNLIKSFC